MIGPDGFFGSSDWETMNPPPRPPAVDATRVTSLLDGRSSGLERDAALSEQYDEQAERLDQMPDDDRDHVDPFRACRP